MLALALALALAAAPPPPPLPAPPPLASPAGANDPLRGDWSKPSGKRITLSGALPVDDAIQRVADAAGWNLVLNTGPTGSRVLTLKLRDVPVEDALKAALTGVGLVATRTGSTVVVAAAAEATPAEIPVLVGFDKQSGKKFTGDFDDEDVGDALKRVASSAGLSIVLPQGELPGTITASFKDVPVEDALRAVLAQGSLTAERQGELIVVRRGPSLLDEVLPPGLSREAQRTAEEAMREAQVRMKEALVRHRQTQGSAERARDREVTGSDLAIQPGEQVRDVSVVKGNLRLKPGAEARDTSVVMGSLSLDPGATVRDGVAVLGSVNLGTGATAREVVSVLGNVTIGPGANVSNDVVSVGGRVTIDPTAHVGGGTHSVSFPTLPKVPGDVLLHAFPRMPSSPVTMVVGTLVRFIMLFVLGLLVLAVVPRRVEAVSGAIVARPWISLLAGLIGTVGVFVLGILLAVTVVGILLIPVEILLVLGGGVLGITALTHYIGRRLPFPPSRRTMVLELAAGTLIFAILAEIPVLGGMVWVAAWLVTFGAVLRSRFGQTASALPTTPATPA